MTMMLLIGLLGWFQTPLERLDRIEAETKALRVILTPPPPSTPNPVVIRVPVGGNVQAAIDLAPAGAEIRLAQGQHLVNLRLVKPVTLRSDVTDAALTLTQGGWVNGPGLALAHLVPSDATQAIVTITGDDVTVLGLEIGGNDRLPDRDLVVVEGTRTLIDRNYIHGGANGGHRGVSLQGADTRVTRNWIGNLWESGRDSQAIAGWGGPGPYLIESNFLEATGENVLFGGSDPSTVGLIPSDITIRGNLVSKPAVWRAQHPGSVKNLLELKNARRVVIENNVLERNWPDAQNGAGILFTVRNQDGGCPWCSVESVTFQYNVVRDIEGVAFNLLGQDDIHASAQGHDIAIRHNLCIRCQDGFLVNNGYARLSILNNTLTTIAGKLLQLTGGHTPGLVMQDNISASGTYGIVADGTAPGTASLAAWAPGAVFAGNILTLGVPYPAGNEVIATLPLDATRRYTGSRRPIPGADVDELHRRIQWAIF